MSDVLTTLKSLFDLGANTVIEQARASRVVLDPLHIVFNGIFNLLLVIATLISLVYIILSLISFFKAKNTKAESSFDAKKAPFVTIQIPTRNEIIALRCARKCLEFDYPKDSYEILIGDDSNKSEVSLEIDSFASKHPMVKVIRRESNIGFKPGNLNNMLKHTKGEIIVIFDSDFAPAKDFLKRIVAPFIHDSKLAAVQARWQFINANENLVTVLASTIVYVFHYIFQVLLRRDNTAFLCGSAEAVRKSELVRLGGWLSGTLTEDIEYSLRLIKNGGHILYLPDLHCDSEVPSKPKDLYRQQMRWAHGVISAYKIHLPEIIVSNKISLKRKILSTLNGFGYLIPIFIFLLTIAGVLSFATDAPAPIDLARFFGETGRNILLTMGLLFASVVALYRADKLKLVWKMIASSFTYGLVTTYYVNIGICKAILRKPMEWYLLTKSTNYMKD